MCSKKVDALLERMFSNLQPDQLESKEEETETDLTNSEKQEFQAELLRRIERLHYDKVVQLVKNSKGCSYRPILLEVLGKHIGTRWMPEDLTALLQALEPEEYVPVLFGHLTSSFMFIRFMKFLKAQRNEESLDRCRTLYQFVKEKNLIRDVITKECNQIKDVVEVASWLLPEDLNDLLQKISFVRMIKNPDDLSKLLRVLDAEGCRLVFAALKEKEDQIGFSNHFQKQDGFLSRILVGLNAEQSTAVGLELKDFLSEQIDVQWIPSFFSAFLPQTKRSTLFWVLQDILLPPLEDSFEIFELIIGSLREDLEYDGSDEDYEKVREIHLYLKPILLNHFQTLDDKDGGSFLMLLNYLTITENDDREAMAKIFDPLFSSFLNSNKKPDTSLVFAQLMCCLNYLRRNEEIVEILERSKEKLIEWTENCLDAALHKKEEEEEVLDEEEEEEEKEEENPDFQVGDLFEKLNSEQAAIVFAAIKPVIQRRGSDLSTTQLASLLHYFPDSHRSKAYENFTGKSLGNGELNKFLLELMKSFSSPIITGSSDWTCDTFLSISQSSADKQRELGGFKKRFEAAWVHSVLIAGEAADPKGEEAILTYPELQKAFDDLVERANIHRRRPNVFFTTYLWGNTKSCDQLIEELSVAPLYQLKVLNEALGLNLDSLAMEDVTVVKQAFELYIRNMSTAAVKEEAAPAIHI